MKLKFPSFPIATAMCASMQGYNFVTLKQDVIAGLIVSMVALPLSMALSIAVGLPPQNGLYTAIIAGFAAALLGGSPAQVTGPTAAFVVIVAPIVAQYGLHGIIWCEMMAGVLLLVMGTARLGRYINYVPYPVTVGFTAGIAVVIATLALNDLLGLGIGQLSGSYLEKVMTIAAHLPALNAWEFLVGGVSLVVILFFWRITKIIPSPIVGITVGTVLAYVLSHYGIHIATIGSRFTYDLPGGGIAHGIPPYPPVLHWPGGAADSLFSIPTYLEFRSLFMPAAVIAALAALESLLSATVADGLAGTRHDPNAELNGIGIANILSGLAGGIPATGAIARTATNIHSGAKTPMASVIHAVLLLLYIILFAPLINFIPMASLAALLVQVAYRMSHVKQFARILKIAPRSDSVVLLTCFILTVFVDMVAGVTIGILMAALLFMQRISETTEINVAISSSDIAEEFDLVLPQDVMVYRIDGPLFFGTVEKAYDRHRHVPHAIRRVVIDMARVPLIDMTGLMAMKSLLTTIAQEGREIVLCGKPALTDRVMQKIAGTPAAALVKTAPGLREALA